MRQYFIDESLVQMIVKYTANEAACRGDEEFLLNLHKLQTFIKLRYPHGLARFICNEHVKQTR